MDQAPLGDQSAMYTDATCRQRTGTSQGHGEGSCARRRMISYKRHNKPPYTYLGMIIVAIQYSPHGHMTLAEVTKALEYMFPFFRGSYKGWKDSVRHNISNSRCIVKMSAVPDAGKVARWRVCWDMVPRDVFLLQRGRPGCKEKHWKSTLQQYLGLPDLLLPSQHLPPSSSNNTSNQPSMSCTHWSWKDTTCQKPVFSTETASRVTPCNEHSYDLPTLSSLLMKHSRDTPTSSSTTKQVESNESLQTCSIPSIYRFTQNSTLPHPGAFLPQAASDCSMSQDAYHSPRVASTIRSPVDRKLHLPRVSSATDMPLSPNLSQPSQATSTLHFAGDHTTVYHRYLGNFLFYGPKSPELDLPPIDVCSYKASGYRNQRPLQQIDGRLHYPGALLPRGLPECQQSPRPESTSSDGNYVNGEYNDSFVMETYGSTVQQFCANHRHCTAYDVAQVPVWANVHIFLGTDKYSETGFAQPPSLNFSSPDSWVGPDLCCQPNTKTQSVWFDVKDDNTVNNFHERTSGQVSAKCVGPNYSLSSPFVANKAKYPHTNFIPTTGVSRSSF